MTALLHCDGMSKSFGALTAVQRLSFELAVDEVLGIGGPNGAGKTTLFDLVCGFLAPDEGRLVLDGRDVTGASPDRRCRLGVARTFQLNAGFDTMTIYENVLVGAFYGRVDRFFLGFRVDRESRDAAEAALSFVGLADRRTEIVRNLPVLDRKLLMVASAIATQPRIMLLDEPVGGLTPSEIDVMLEIVRKIRKSGVAIIVIEHVMRFLLGLSDRVMILHHGEKIFEGRPAEVARDNTVKQVYLGEGAADLIAATAGQGTTDGR